MGSEIELRDSVKFAAKLFAEEIEAIDMARRGLHDEGAETLQERMAEFVEMDKKTARRLFTLVCVLHIRA